MKKLIILAAAALLLLPLAGCKKDSASSDAAQETAEQSTDAPYIDTQIDEPEWTLAEGELQLEDGKYIYAHSEDILYFAIVTKDDGKKELRFRMRDMLQGNPDDTTGDYLYDMKLNGEKIGKAVLSEDHMEAIITEDNAVGDITVVASRIRGLTE